MKVIYIKQSETKKRKTTKHIKPGKGGEKNTRVQPQLLKTNSGYGGHRLGNWHAFHIYQGTQDFTHELALTENGLLAHNLFARGPCERLGGHGRPPSLGFVDALHRLQASRERW